MARKHIPKPQPKHQDGRVQPSWEESACRHLTISFKYHKNGENGKFGIPEDSQFPARLTDRLKQICAWSESEFRQKSGREKEWRIHPHVWNHTSEPNGFGLPIPEMNDVEGWQFGLGKGGGRVHGFFLRGIFFVVWIDREHELYPAR